MTILYKTIAVVLIYTLAYILTGSSAIAQAPDYQWAKRAGGSNGEYGNSIAVDASGNSYVTGDFWGTTITFGSTTLTNASSTNKADIFIVKYDAAGAALWANRAGGSFYDYGNSIAVDSNGNSYVTGYFLGATITFGSTTLTNAGSTGTADIFIVKYDGSGAVLWAKSAGGSYYDRGNSIAVDASGNTYVTGYFRSVTATFGSTTLTNASADTADIFIVKYDATGSALWAKRAGGSSDEMGASIAVDASGNSYVTGYFRSTAITFGSTTLTYNPYYSSIFIVKYNAAGAVLWAKSAGGSSCNSIAVDVSGNTYVTGNFYSATITFGSTTLTNASAGTSDIFIVKYDGSGAVLWAKSVGGSADDYGNSIAVDASGNSFVTSDLQSATITFGSTTLTNAGIADILVVKYDATGAALWAKSAGGSSIDGGKSIAVDASGNAYVTGDFGSATITFGSTTLINQGASDMFIAKLNSTTGIESLRNIEGVVSYPNPTNGKLSIELPNNHHFVSFEIYNVLGEKVVHQQNTPAGLGEIDLSTFQKGIYFACLQMDNGTKVYHQKIVVQ